ncbi:MAG: Na-translocating system protein MpsC family protein [Pirellulales bacterium]
MNHPNPTIAQQLAHAARTFQEKRTGRAPKAVTVVLSEDTLVVTLHGALSPAEQSLAKNSRGAADLQEFHRQLFGDSVDSLRKEIKRITGRDVCEAAAEIDPATGSIVHAFTTGTVVQVFLLAENVSAEVCAPDGELAPA